MEKVLYHDIGNIIDIDLLQQEIAKRANIHKKIDNLHEKLHQWIGAVSRKTLTDDRIK